MRQERQSVAPHPIPESAFRKELPLRDLLRDPVIGKLMARDGVSRSDLLRLLDGVRDGLAERRQGFYEPAPKAA